jgi:DNA-binding GntR family transcriptional regulator
MLHPIPIKRQNVSDSVETAVRQMIVLGQLGENERINEVHLAERLNVSRTPLREALNRLSGEGALVHAPALGYSVKALTLEEFEAVYGMRPILDPAALKLAGLPSPERLARLRALNARIESSRSAERALDFDDAWHTELVAACPNPVLLDLIAHFMLRTRRYELALLRERREILMAGANHRAIMAALRRRDLDGACDALRHNLERGREPLLTWLKQRSAKG